MIVVGLIHSSCKNVSLESLSYFIVWLFFFKDSAILFFVK